MTCQLCECKIGTSYTFSSDPLPCEDCGEWIEIHLETSVYRGFDEEGFHCFRLHKSKRCPGCQTRLFTLRYYCDNNIDVTEEFVKLPILTSR